MWSRALDVRLSEWCCSESMVWVQIPSREEQNLTALKSNSNTVWFNFQTYIIFSINLVSFKVTLRSSGTDILYGCHLLLDVCIYIYIYIYVLYIYIYIYIYILYIYITNLVCYAYFHWLFNPECQHIFGKQTGYICTFSVSLIWAPKNNNNVVDKNRNIYASLNQYHNTD